MTTTPNPTWYDILGVSRDASPDAIKAAWRNATDRFEPGSGSAQFRMFNDAAEVLLDPARRAAYDESLERPSAPVEAEEPFVEGPRGSEPPPVTEPKPKRPRKTRRVRPVGEPASRRALVLTLVLSLLSVAALAAAITFGLKVRNDAAVADARKEAPAAAEAAAKAVLAYDYRHLAADRERVSGFLTDSFRKDYLKNFSLLEKQKDGSPGAAVQTKAVVTTSVPGSGVMDAEADVVRVLVFVNQTSTKPGKQPQVFQNRVAMTMKKSGDRWLVDDLKSY